MKKIPLTKGKYAFVEDEDYETVNQYKWCYCNGYAMRRQYMDDGSSKYVYMHRFINDTPEGLETDHINRNKLDNRKENLRNVTRKQNALNIGKQKRNTSGHQGVYFFKRDGSWESRIGLNGKNIFLGRFMDIKDAIEARKKAELIYYKI